jgi:hypothetical protein
MLLFTLSLDRLPDAYCRPKADHCAYFGECPLLGDEPPFPSGTSRPLETLLSLFDIYFSDRLRGPKGDKVKRQSATGASS